MCVLFLSLKGGKKKIRKRNRKVLQLSGEALKHVSKEEGASATRGISFLELFNVHVALSVSYSTQKKKEEVSV